MTLNQLLEDSNRSPYIAFDIETYSPNGFPEKSQDPVVTTTLAFSVTDDPRDGLVLLSLIFPPDMEDLLLSWLYHFLCSSPGLLVTYNGTRFDLGYVKNRGLLHGIDFSSTFSRYEHLDVYQIVRQARLQIPRYSQRAVEHKLRINRVVNDVNGASYHKVFDSFLKFGDLRPLFYNIEDAVGCMRILSRLMQDWDEVASKIF